MSVLIIGLAAGTMLSMAMVLSYVLGCTYGCMGFGNCATACKFDAIAVVDGLATVDYEKCVGCGACAEVCPRNIITITPFKSERIPAVTCSNKDKGKDITKVCTVGCMGCGACARTSELFKMEGNLPTIDYDIYKTECSLDTIKPVKNARVSALCLLANQQMKMSWHLQAS